MIPEVALEAAAKAFYPSFWSSPRDVSKWDTEHDDIKERCREKVRPILEAASPHMLADGEPPSWDEREELADVFTGHAVGFGVFPKRLMRGFAQEIASLILAAGYRKVAK